MISLLVKKENKTKLGKDHHTDKKHSDSFPSGTSMNSETQSFTATEVKSHKPKKVRTHISVKVRRELLKKADYRCEHTDAHAKMKCESTYQLQIDHINPIVLGGTNEIKNLRILCGAHNRISAEKRGLRR